MNSNLWIVEWWSLEKWPEIVGCDRSSKSKYQSLALIPLDGSWTPWTCVNIDTLSDTTKYAEST
jgi:hypothetical protein